MLQCCQRSCLTCRDLPVQSACRTVPRAQLAEVGSVVCRQYCNAECCHKIMYNSCLLHSAGMSCCLSDVCDPIKLVTVSMGVQPLCLIDQVSVVVMQDLLLLSSVHWRQIGGLSSRQPSVGPWQMLGMQRSTNQRQVLETTYPFSVGENHMSPQTTSHAPCASALPCLGQALLFRYGIHSISYTSCQTLCSVV